MSHTVVVVGSGSAGRRHASAIRERLPDADLLVVRRPESTQPAEMLGALGATLLPSLDAALGARPTIAVVAGPATHHRDAADRLLRSGSTVLVEKPLAATLADALAISSIEGSDRSTIVGYHLRCSDTVGALREQLDRRVIGELTGFDLRVGQHLGQWRRGVDARSGVSARQDLGGGVLLELSHELDAVLQLLGPVGAVGAMVRTDGAPTDGVVETVADLDVVLQSGVAGTVHLDMVSDPAFRTWTLRGGSGELHVDLLAGTIEVRGDNGTQLVHRSEPGERDRAEEALIENLVAVAEGRAQPVCSVQEGLEVLALVDAARRSVTTGSSVPIDSLLSVPAPDRSGGST